MATRRKREFLLPLAPRCSRSIGVDQASSPGRQKRRVVFPRGGAVRKVSAGRRTRVDRPGVIPGTEVREQVTGGADRPCSTSSSPMTGKGSVLRSSLASEGGHADRMGSGAGDGHASREGRPSSPAGRKAGGVWHSGGQKPFEPQETHVAAGLQSSIGRASPLNGDGAGSIPAASNAKTFPVPCGNGAILGDRQVEPRLSKARKVDDDRLEFARRGSRPVRPARSAVEGKSSCTARRVNRHTLKKAAVLTDLDAPKGGQVDESRKGVASTRIMRRKRGQAPV